MVNKNAVTVSRVSTLVRAYVAVVLATLVVLVVLAAVAPAQATSEAWGHAIVVTVFAVVLPLRLRPARRGNTHALGAVAVIAGVLVVVNLVEAAIPGFVPTWMRLEMVLIAALAATLAALAARGARWPRS